jgi:hypothetical protein
MLRMSAFSIPSVVIVGGTGVILRMTSNEAASSLSSSVGKCFFKIASVSTGLSLR